jgi:hypothetical protein
MVRDKHARPPTLTVSDSWPVPLAELARENPLTPAAHRSPDGVVCPCLPISHLDTLPARGYVASKDLRSPMRRDGATGGHGV